MKNYKVITFDDTVSEAIQIGADDFISGIIFPDDAAFDSKTLSVSVSIDGDDYFPLYDKDGNQVSITAGANRSVYLDPINIFGFQYIKLAASGSVDGKSISVIYNTL